MVKYIILELASIASFVLLFIFYRQIEKQTQLELVFTILFLILFILILLIIPAMILLSLRDKRVPSVLKTSQELRPRYFAILTAFVVLSWVFYLLSTLFNNMLFRYLSYIIVPLAFFIVLLRIWKSVNFKKYLIFIALIAITFVIVLFLFQSLLLIPFYF